MFRLLVSQSLNEHLIEELIDDLHRGTQASAPSDPVLVMSCRQATAAYPCEEAHATLYL